MAGPISSGYLVADFPRSYDLPNRFLEGLRDFPLRIVGAHLAEIRIIADVVPGTVLIKVRVNLGLTRKFLCDFKGFEDGGAVRFAAAQIIDLARAWISNEGRHKTGDVKRVNVIAHLFTLITKHAIFAALEIAFYQIRKKPVEFDSRMIWSGEAAAAQSASGHIKIASVFLHHHISRNLGGAKEGVLRLVDGERFWNTVGVGRISVVPASRLLDQLDTVGGIAINLIRAHVHEGRLGTGLAGGFKKVKRPNSIRIEIVERNRGGAIVRGLGSGVDDYGWLHRFNEGEDASSVPNIEFVVDKTLQLRGESALIPARIALWAEEHGALVVINAMNSVALPREINANFGAD